MKKIKSLSTALAVLGFITISFSGFSQTSSHDVSPVQVGSTTLNIGIGVGSDYKGDSYGTPFGFKVAAEFGLWQAGPGVITLGPELGGSFSNGGYYDDYHSHTFVIAGRGAWHYGWQVPGLDTYGGFSAGIGFHHYQYTNNQDYDYNQVIPAFGAFVGASYFISPNVGFNAEAGYDITNFQVGVIFKLQ
ncbi:MAG TPA: hypothetical protein VG890_12330 [Puia sp.]|nr:hypothetical protein [Puia sp.]